MSWQVQKAKQKFSELVRKALGKRPQVVTRHDEEVAVLVSAETYRKLSGSGKDFKTFLLEGSDLSELGLERFQRPCTYC